MIQRVEGYYKKLIKQFWKSVDAEGVAMFQRLFYVLFVVTGLYGLIFINYEPKGPLPPDASVGVPQAITETMSPFYYTIWLGLNVVGPLMALWGKRLKGERAYAGYILQLAGDIGVFFALGTYIGAIIDTSFLGRGLYAVFIVFAAWISSMLFIARDIRRLARVEMVAQIEKDYYKGQKK